MRIYPQTPVSALGTCTGPGAHCNGGLAVSFALSVWCGSMALGKELARGAAGTVYVGQVEGQTRAIKEIKCDILDEDSVTAVAAEIEMSWLLARGCPKNLIIR